MIEVPALLFQIRNLRFGGISSRWDRTTLLNPLRRDRENRQVAQRYDPLGVASLRALRLIADTARESDCRVSICGESPTPARGDGAARSWLSDAVDGPVISGPGQGHAARLDAQKSAR